MKQDIIHATPCGKISFSDLEKAESKKKRKISKSDLRETERILKDFFFTDKEISDFLKAVNSEDLSKDVLETRRSRLIYEKL